ncbi:MAG TPA: c-type cytochrome [Chitinophagaceae bacterium]|jgi:mono/diheme cytochrome c family protein|nr:c-type cytochrome [Chitinophagaceae bacterium]
MRKIFALVAIVAAVASVTYFTACNNNKKEEPQASNKEDSLQKVIARGEYLANHVAGCMDCHSKRDFTKYSGPPTPGTEGEGGEAFSHDMLDAIPGVIYSRNITPDPETGIGTWTDDDILKAITQGINKNGDTLFPLMPYANFNHMAKSDLLSIIAYLHTLKPIKNKVPERHLMIPLSLAYPAQALQKSIDSNMAPPESDPVKYGGYLVNLADCGTCHTPFVKGQPDFSRMFSGGNTFTLPTFKVTTANITPDSATGIGTWTLDRFMNKFTVCREESGYNYDPGKENTIMPVKFYSGMTDNDLSAIYAYLRTVKPIKHEVVKYPK